MTRRDYEMLAGAIRDSRPWNADANPYAPGPVAWLATAYTLAQRLMRENPRFDAGRFMSDCGASWSETEKRFIAKGA